jgi:hypothetical protein
MDEVKARKEIQRQESFEKELRHVSTCMYIIYIYKYIWWVPFRKKRDSRIVLALKKFTQWLGSGSNTCAIMQMY